MAQVMNDLPHLGIATMMNIISPGNSDSSLDGLQEEKAKLESLSFHPRKPKSSRSLNASNATNVRLNKFVRRLHEMLTAERDGGVVEWRRGLLVLHSIDNFSKEVLPKYFNTRNFKTFRRQLNYYGFLHVRSFSASGSTTTALWVNQELADHGDDSISSVLKLKRVEPNDSSKTPEGRRERKNEAVSSVEVEGLGGLLPGYNDVQEKASSDCPVPEVVHCQQAPVGTSFQPLRKPMVLAKNSYEHVALPVLAKKEDTFIQHEEHVLSLIDHLEANAAGLLLSLSHAAA